MAKKGVLLVNLGTPDSAEVKDVRKYLDQFLMDERVIDIAKFLKADKGELLTLWMADKIESSLIEEPKVAYEAMKIANKNLKK